MKSMVLIAILFASLIGCSQNETAINAGTSDENSQEEIVGLSTEIVEGDMVMFRLPDTIAQLAKQKTSLLQPTFRFDQSWRLVNTWQQFSTIKYYFDLTTFPNLLNMTLQQKNEFRRALKDISNGNKTSFQEVKSRENAQTIAVRVFDIIPNNPTVPGHSLVGASADCSVCYDNGNQYIELSAKNGGLTYRTFVHEVMHTLGFAHEHQRADLDENIVYVKSGGIGFDSWDGDVLSTPYDPASIMHYNVDGEDLGYNVDVEALPDYKWMGKYPLLSRYDRAGMAREYSSEPETENIVRLYNTKAKKYLCLNSSMQLYTIGYAPAGTCQWNMTPGSVALESRYSGPVTTYWNDGPKFRNISGSVPTSQYTYLTVKMKSDGTFTVGTEVQATSQYASAIIPFTHAKGAIKDGSVLLWSIDACLDVDVSGNPIAIRLAEEKMRAIEDVSASHAGCFWNIIPQWDVTKPY